MQFGKRFLWVLGVIFLGQCAWAATAVTESLRGRSFVDAEDSAAYLSQLVDVSEADWRAAFPYVNRSMLDQVARGFLYQSPKGEIEIKLHLMKKGAESYSNLILLGIFQNRATSEPVGFFSIHFRRSNTGQPEAIGDLLKTDLSGDLGGIFAPFFSTYETLIAIHRVREERILAGWTGRLIWAAKGLYEYDQDYSYNLNNRSVAPVVLVRENFARFLDHHEIRMEDLSYRGGPLVSLAQLGKPADFLKVRHREGKKILVQAYVDSGEVRAEDEYSVGMAFFLSDSRPQPNQSNEIWLGGRKYSDRAMPAWPGIRIHAGCCPPASPPSEDTCAARVWTYRGGSK